jgi:CubicO group peptidase (beta-lactamase class C family)
VVKDGRVVYARGYGVRRMGAPERVTANTRFQIASNTKAFTTAALAMLVDEGRLRWDDRVIDHLPGFQLADPYVTRELTVRDLLTHRSGLGLGAGDLLWYGSDYPRDTILYRIRRARFTTSFRSAYAYDNVLYVAAGQLVPAVTGESWESFVSKRILRPLGMRDATTSIGAFQQGDWATPHGKVEGRYQVTHLDTADATAPAGGLGASVADLAKWMIVQLDSGRVRAGGPGALARLWTAARTRDMWTGVTVLPIGAVAPGLEPLRANFSLYGLGWFLRDYRGRKLVTHTGSLAGMLSRTAMIPSEKLGVVVLTNGETSLQNALAFRVLDAFLGAPPNDWATAYHDADVAEEREAAEVERRASTARDSTSRPSLPLARYAARYTDPMYGDATIADEHGTLVLRLVHSPAFVADLVHFQYDTFVARWRLRSIPDAYVTFALTPQGAVDTFRMAAVSPLADFSFDFQDLTFSPAAAGTGAAAP